MKRAARVLALVGLATGYGTAAGAATEWKTRSELSYVNTTGNSETQIFAGKIETSADATPNRYFAEAKWLFGENNDTTSSSRWIAAGRYERAITERLFGFVAADYLKDTFSGYDMRVTVGPGIGYDFLTGDVHTLKGLLSVPLVREDLHAVPEPSDDTETYASGKVEGNYAWQITEVLLFRQDANFSISFKESDVYFAKSTTGIEAKLNDKLALGLSYIVNYQHDPAGDAEHTDTIFLTSLVIDF